MGIDFIRPLLLIAFPVCMAFIIFAYFKFGSRSLKNKVALALRTLVILLLCLSVAGISVLKRSSDASLMIVVDRSESLSGRSGEIEGKIREIADSLPENYKAGIISFGRNTAVEQHFNQSLGDFSKLETEIDDRYSDISAALQFASALFDNDSSKQILLISDGKENLGDAYKSARILESQGIRIDVMPLESRLGQNSGDAQVSKLEIPSRLYEGESFDIKVTLHSNAAKDGKLYLYGDKNLIAEKDVQLQNGENIFVFEDVAYSSGVVKYEAVLQEQGGLSQNNRMTQITRVVGKPRILLVEGSSGDARELEKMLKASDMSVNIVSPQSLSADIDAWQAYQAVVLCNVSAEDLEKDQIKAMDTFVKTLGRGMLTIGGDNSYALGSYIGSDIEKMLPIDMDVRNKLDMPSLGLMLVIDKSGSMADGRYGITRQDLANESAVRSLEVLSEKDQIGVIAFDSLPKWVVDLQNPADLEAIKSSIGSIRPGGGTMMYGALRQATDALTGADTKIKHIICLTDGQPGDTGFEELVFEMRDNGITLSTVGVGDGANLGLLQQLALIGNGRYYDANEFSNLPQIFAKETFLATQSYLQNVTFFPKVVSSSPITDRFSGFPQLDGYLAAVTKSTAHEILSSDKDTPILAHWQYGLGKVASWMSDARGMWTEHYLNWNQGGLFFSSIVNFVLPAEGDEGIVDLRIEGNSAVLELQSEQWENVESAATVILPDGSTESIDLSPTAPGSYEARFNTDQEGAYTIRVEQRQNGELINVIESGLPVTYSSEFDLREQDGGPLLESIRSVTKGHRINSASDIFSNPMERVESRVDIWPYLLLAAFILFFIDIALRRLAWENKAIAAIDNWKAKRDKRKKESEALPIVPAKKAKNSSENEGQSAEKSKKRKEKSNKGKAKETENAGTSDLSSELLRRKNEKKKM